jgi:hypothetical protein
MFRVWIDIGICCMLLWVTANNYNTPINFHTPRVSRGSAVSIVTGCRLEDWEIESESWYDKEFSLLHVIHTVLGSRPVFCLMGTRNLSPGIKWQGCEAYRSPPTGAKVKEMWTYIAALPCAFMVYCFRHRDNFTFLEATEARSKWSQSAGTAADWIPVGVLDWVWFG